MEIISSGKNKAKDGSVIFTCPNCGCKFKADPTEYYQDSSWANGGISTTYTFTNTYTVKYHANCPECHRMCLETEDKGNNYWYSVTCDGNTISSDHITVTCNQQSGDTGD